MTGNRPPGQPSRLECNLVILYVLLLNVSLQLWRMPLCACLCVHLCVDMHKYGPTPAERREATWIFKKSHSSLDMAYNIPRGENLKVVQIQF